MLSEKDSCLRNLNWSDLMAEAPPKSILYGRRYLNLSTATDMCLQYFSKSEPHIGEIELTSDSKKIPPWLFRAVVDVPVILRQQVDIMEDRTSPVPVSHCFLEARFKEQRRINFQAGFTNWSPWTQRWVTLPCWTSCCRPGSPHRSCSATAASWCVSSSWNHDFQQTAKLEPKI